MSVPLKDTSERQPEKERPQVVKTAPAKRRRRAWPVVLGIIACLLLAAIAAILWDGVHILQGLASQVHAAGQSVQHQSSALDRVAQKLGSVQTAWQAIGAAFNNFLNAIARLFGG